MEGGPLTREARVGVDRGMVKEIVEELREVGERLERVAKKLEAIELGKADVEDVEEKYVTVTVRFPFWVKRDLENIASKMGMTEEQLIISFLNDYLKYVSLLDRYYHEKYGKIWEEWEKLEEEELEEEGE